jgi:N6-L-threonylcarbamoyladenine synthase
MAYGGVVPELASRAHQANIVPVAQAAISRAGINAEDISAVAFTRGPGLLGSLLVGTSFAKGFALGRNIPLIEVNHLHAHVLAHFILTEGGAKRLPSFPFLCLLVSGGHTRIILMRSHLEMEVLGNTIDDAAGEAFDKSAKMLGLPYPGGPLIDKHAKEGDANKYKFTEPQIPGFNFSFSGLKTQILYFIQKESKTNPNFVAENLNDLCASIQSRIISILLNKLEAAADQLGITDIAIAGGVSANSGLRAELQRLANKKGWNTFIPAFEYCTDNAGMIAIAGYQKYLKGEFIGQDVAPLARYHI